MNRRKNTFLDDLYKLFLVLPWWVPLIAAAVVFLLLVFLLPAAITASMRAPDILLSSKIFGYAFTIIILVAGITSWITRWMRSRIIDTKQSMDTISDLSWPEFVQLIGEAFHQQGYTVDVVGDGTDKGIDLKLRKDGELVLAQCKQWRAQHVALPPIHELNETITPEGAARAIFITCGDFTAEAIAAAGSTRVQLIDGAQLLQLVNGVEVHSAPTSAPTPATVPTLFGARPACPQCGSAMVKRTVKSGEHAGTQFWGCRQYPKCRGRLPM